MVAERCDALTALVQEQVGTGKRYSTRAFAELAVDPESGYSPGKSLIGKIIGGHSYQISPELVRALATGLSLPPGQVARAAAQQFIGVDDPLPTDSKRAAGVTVRVAHQPGTTSREMPQAQAWVEEVLRRDGDGM